MANALRSINHFIHRLLLLIAQASMIVMVIVVTYTVIARFVFNTGNSWAEELPRILVALFAFLACAMGVRDHLHVAVGVIYNRFPEGSGGRKAMDVLTDVCVLVVGLLMLVYGYQLCVTLAGRNGKMPMTQWPVWVQYISVPVAGFVMSFDSILFLTGIVKAEDKIFSDPNDDPMEKARKLREQEEAAKEAQK